MIKQWTVNFDLQETKGWDNTFAHDTIYIHIAIVVVIRYSIQYMLFILVIVSFSIFVDC